MNKLILKIKTRKSGTKTTAWIPSENEKMKNEKIPGNLGQRQPPGSL